MRWYSVKDKLPKTYQPKGEIWRESKSVLVYCHKDKKPAVLVSTLQVDSDGTTWWDFGGYAERIEKSTVTHWMNTPKPPEEERMAHWITASKQTPRTRIIEKGESGYSMSKRLSVIYLDPHTDRPAYAYAQYRKDHATGRGMWIKDGGEIINTVTHWQKSPLPTNLDEEIAKVRE